MDLGTHYIVDLFELRNEIFTNYLSKNKYHTFDYFVQLSIKENNMTLLNKNVHHFDEPQGAVTALYLLSESHLSLHSWPEHNYLALDIFTCGNCNTKKIVDDIIGLLAPNKTNITHLVRGNISIKQ